jgi:hypothetical protein
MKAESAALYEEGTCKILSCGQVVCKDLLVHGICVDCRAGSILHELDASNLLSAEGVVTSGDSSADQVDDDDDEVVVERELDSDEDRDEEDDDGEESSSDNDVDNEVEDLTRDSGESDRDDVDSAECVSFLLLVFTITAVYICVVYKSYLILFCTCIICFYIFCSRSITKNVHVMNVGN